MMSLRAYAKKLFVLQRKLLHASRSKLLEAEYHTWIKHNPIQENGNFDVWLDTLPSHLIPCFLDDLKLKFPFFDH